MSLKVLIPFVLVISFVCGFTPFSQREICHAQLLCAIEHGVPLADLNNYRQMKFNGDKQSMCHLHCLAKRLALFDDADGPIGKNLIAQLAHVNVKEPIAEIIQKVNRCVTVTKIFKSDVCAWAFFGLGCLHNNGLCLANDVGC